MKNIFLLVISTAVACQVWAYDIAGLETQIGNRSSMDSVVAQATNLILRSYYRGIAETLASQPGKDGRIYVSGEAFICLSQKAEISAELIQAMAESEIKRGDFYQRTYGANWKSLPATVPIFLGLSKMFPCS